MKKLGFFILAILSCLLGLFAVACNKTIEFDYNIDFVVDGEVIATVGTNGDKIAMPKNPTKEDYTFDGWYWDEGEWNEEFTLNSILDQPLQDKNHYKVYAKWKSSIYYTVIFDNGDEEITQQIEYGKSTALRLNTFVPEENFIFIGWEHDETIYQDGEKVLNLCEVGEEFRLFAKWEYDYGSYTITYYPNGGKGEPITQTVVNMSEALLFENPFTAPEYKVFDCWNTSEGGWGVSYQAGEEAPFKNDGYELKLYAKWIENKNTPYKIEHYLQNFENDEYTLFETEYKTGTTGVNVTATPLTFEYYNQPNSNVSGVIKGDGSLVLKVYYDYKTVTVTFALNGGEICSGKQVQNIKYGGDAIAPTVSRRGYEFVQWDKTYTKVMENRTITAMWNVITYYISYDANGGVTPDVDMCLGGRKL